MLGPHLTNWSVRVALLLYFASAAREIRSGRGDAWAKWTWLAGCLVFLSHVFFAFYYHHNMSHLDAFQNTAERTEAALGFAFGGGIYFSYAFTLLWLIDAVWRVAWTDSYLRRAAWLHAAIHVYLFFIAINGAAVFEAGVTRWGSLIGCVVLAGLAWTHRTNWASETSAAPPSEANPS